VWFYVGVKLGLILREERRLRVFENGVRLTGEGKRGVAKTT
jgi:hypothetical protein